MEVTKPYEFIGCGAMDGPKPYKFIGFGIRRATRSSRGAEKEIKLVRDQVVNGGCNLEKLQSSIRKQGRHAN
jgi:hypothetical protein